jgi:photosystem II stability/assembly factor-like uncharacterized protein
MKRRITCLALVVVVHSLNVQMSQADLVQWGKTSLSLSGHDVIGTAVSPGGTLFASDGFGIYRSQDQGNNWPTVTGSTSFAGGAIAIDPSDPNVMIAGRSYGLLKSIDGGQNWFELPDLNAGPAARAITFDPNNSLTVYAGVGYGWGLYKSVNGGATWTNPLPSRDVYAVTVDPLNSQVIYAGTHVYSPDQGGVLKSIDGGSSWSTIYQGNQNVTSFAIDPKNSQSLYLGTEDAGIFRSLDGGTTWSNISGSSIVTPVRNLLFSPDSSQHLLFASTSGQGVFYTSNGGVTWSSTNAGLTDLTVESMAIQGQSPYTMLVATYGGNGFRGTVVPEPSTWVLLCTFSGVVLLFKRFWIPTK